MAISSLPTSKEIELSLLQLLSDGKEHRWKETVDELADHFFPYRSGIRRKATKRMMGILIPTGFRGPGSNIAVLDVIVE